MVTDQTASTEIAVRQEPFTRRSLAEKMAYAKQLADSQLVPRDYQRKPANILYAIEFGEMLGLSAMAAITGIHIIEGKPSASAGLISALVRRAGHKLRLRGDAKSATCQIIRSDDPEYTFEVTFTLEDAKTANLLGKSVWRQYPQSMLKARAITQCARDACEEALFGLHYTPEELGADVDEEGIPLGAPAYRGTDTDPGVFAQEAARRVEEAIPDAEIVEEELAAPAQVRAIGMLLDGLNCPEAAQAEVVSELTGILVTSVEQLPMEAARNLAATLGRLGRDPDKLEALLREADHADADDGTGYGS